MKNKVAKWGNSLAVRIPAALSPLRMSDVLAAITDENIHQPVDFGRSVGKEVI